MKVAELEKKTLGGILLPNSSQKKPTSGDVVAVGTAKHHDLTLKEGNTVLYSKFGLGVVDVSMAGTEYAILYERDCIGIMPRSNASVDDIKDIKPLGDRVLIKVRRLPSRCSPRSSFFFLPSSHCFFYTFPLLFPRSMLQKRRLLEESCSPMTGRKSPRLESLWRSGPERSTRRQAKCLR